MSLSPSLSVPLRALALLGALAGNLSAACAASELVPLAGHRFEVASARPADARAVVVFENGSRETMDTWSAVLSQLPRDVAAFTYNRAGYGRSEPGTGARDGRAIVEELRQLLRTQGLAPPYVLVGHSLGGLYVQLFARQHPEEVRGLVLVDAVYPGIIKRPEEFPLYTRVAKHLFLGSAVEAEIDRIHDTGEEVLALPAPDALAIVQLFNVPKSATAVAVDFGTVNDDPATVARVKAMYPQARKVVLDSDHRIQTADPEAVVAAIGSVLAAAPTAR
jgi:pimeloyl-ACP methyl ester carboxylesterase